MSLNELQITSAKEEDLASLAAFMRATGQKAATREYLHHWYFCNPSGSASVMIGRIDGNIVGMATTNDHYFMGPEGRVLVAMPQKVLTGPEWRGKGIFNKLYKAAEAKCLDRGADLFLTVTNKASTPIFLSKFGYVRAKEPTLLALPFALGTVPPTSAPVLSTIAATGAGGAYRMIKDEAHLQWRYMENEHGGHLHYSFPDRGELFLKKIHKKGLPIMLLMDMISRSSPVALLKTAQRLAREQRALGVLAMASSVAPDLPGIKLASGFNLLVKGRDHDHTTQLAQRTFDLTFGDLDFF